MWPYLLVPLGRSHITGFTVYKRIKLLILIYNICFFRLFYCRLWKKNSLAEFCLFVYVCLFRLMFFFDNIEKPHDDCTCAHVYRTNVRRSTTPLRTATSYYWRIFRPEFSVRSWLSWQGFYHAHCIQLQRIIAMQFLYNPLFLCNTVYTIRHH